MTILMIVVSACIRLYTNTPFEVNGKMEAQRADALKVGDDFGEVEILFDAKGRFRNDDDDEDDDNDDD